jgi:hypothetical protein
MQGTTEVQGETLFDPYCWDLAKVDLPPLVSLLPAFQGAGSGLWGILGPRVYASPLWVELCD